MMLRVVAVIAGRYNGATAGDDTMRAKLLAPILRQNAALAESFRRKRTVTDVNPNSGEDEPVPIEWASSFARTFAASEADRTYAWPAIARNARCQAYRAQRKPRL